MTQKRAIQGILYLFMVLIAVTAVYAAGEIVQVADRLNYWDAESHTVTVTNTGTESTNVTIPLPSGWTITGTTGGCSDQGTYIQCLLAGSGSGTYTVTSPGATDAEYTVTKFIPSTNNSYTGNNVSMLRIQCEEIFHTLVEFGRGRGNYFFNSNSGKAGSGQTEEGCAYLPNSSFIELNFLHKTYNVKQYYSVVANAYNATYTCTYPNDTIVRQHLDTSITRSAEDWTVDFLIEQIGGSWERFGYIGMQFDPGDYSVGQNITINCSSISYYLPVAGGYMLCDEDSFTLEFRDREPFNATASASSTIYNGTQEVEITYTITNDEIYTVSDAVIEIKAPLYAEFIGTRGELWGTAMDVYRIEKASFLPGESYTITLVARFDTSLAPAITSLNLTEGISIQYVTCWEYNAYNPAKYIQDLADVGTGTVDMATTSQITSIIDLINRMYNISLILNSSIFAMNQTIQDIYNLTLIINTSTWNISYQVWTYPTRELTYYPPGGTGSASSTSAVCSWDSTAWYQDTTAQNIIYIYNSTIARVDFPNVFNDTVDTWRVCHKTGISNGTGTGDLLEIYVCNDYNGSANPHDDPGCSLIDVEDPTESVWVSGHLKWECDNVLAQEVSGTNITVLFKCDTCHNESDAWQLAYDIGVDLNYTFNSSDTGITWNNVSGEALVDLSWCMPIDFGYEVWSYNNRTLTEYNFTELLNQFNCSSGASTNEMCALLYAINLTTTNMQSTINIINATVMDINSTVYLVYNDTGYIIDLLNCNTSVDTPICNYVIDINSTLYSVQSAVTNITSIVNSINNTLYIMNQSIFNRFDGIDANLSLIYNLSLVMYDLINCTNITAQWQNSTCSRLERIEQYSIYMNSTIEDILSIVNYINGTRWMNYTVQDILDAINNVSNNLDLTEVLNELRRLREFDEELVFLVTDAFNMQQRAKSAVAAGDYSTAMTSLKDAKDNLEKASLRLAELRSMAGDERGLFSSDSYWWIWLILVSLVIATVVYLFQRVPEEPPRMF